MTMTHDEVVNQLSANIRWAYLWAADPETVWAKADSHKFQFLWWQIAPRGQMFDYRTSFAHTVRRWILWRKDRIIKYSETEKTDKRRMVAGKKDNR